MDNPVERCVILGGGGHLRVLLDTLQKTLLLDLFVILDPDRALWGKDVLGVPVVGNDARLPELFEHGFRKVLVAIGSVGSTAKRRRLFRWAIANRFEPLSVIDPSAVVSPSAILGIGVQLLPRSVVNAGAKVGANVIVNSGSIVEHDCAIGDHVHIATGAILAGAVKVMEGAHVGCGAVIRECVTVGANARVGAGAVVVEDVPPAVTVVGVPARPLTKRAANFGERVRQH